MSPDHNHVGISLKQVIPDLQVLNLLEVLLWLVGLVKESSEVRTKEVLPPAIVPCCQRQLIFRNKTTCQVIICLNSR